MSTLKLDKQSVHDRAMARFARTVPPQLDVRRQCLQDRRFVHVQGAQWEGNLEQQFANRPRFEVNKVHMAVMRLFNEYRNNRISVDFRAKDNGASSEAAETLDGLYRADEQRSGAQEAYDNAFDDACSGGFGGWRLIARYEDDDNEDGAQRICLDPIYDADTSLYFDIDARRQDKGDASYAFLVTAKSRMDYEEEHGEIPASWPKDTAITDWDWFTPDVVYLAEYYEVHKIDQEFAVFVSSDGGQEETVLRDEKSDDYLSTKRDFEDMGYEIARYDKKKRKVVRKWILDGSRVLEDCGIIAGNCIPLVPVYGKRAYVDNIERIQGHVRLTTDLMRLYNMLISLLAEICVFSPIEKPIFTPAQIQGHESTWAADNINRNPYLLINETVDAQGNPVLAGPVGTTKPPSLPQSVIALMELCNIDMRELLGDQQKGEQLQSNISAKAVELVQSRLTMQNFIYNDNMAKAMKRSGEIWLGMAKDLYNEEGREMRILANNGEENVITLMQPHDEGGGIEYKNDFTAGSFEVITDVGPSFAASRDGTVKALTAVMQYAEDPVDKQAITGVILQNIDGEGLQGIKAFNRKRLVRMGVVKPTKEEAEELAMEAQNQQPSAQDQYFKAEAGKAQALAIKATADTEKAIADAEKTRTETAEMLAQSNAAKLEQVLKILAALQQSSQAQQAAPQGAMPPVEAASAEMTQSAPVI